ncbi:MAG TPA: polysaccharide biosynthesis/export family protein [Candidatus Acidoferrales bacterium]|nr:polysaccharide biosynthesis/export family protein [Candidatus Acidoferrales bacterium]
MASTVRRRLESARAGFGLIFLVLFGCTCAFAQSQTETAQQTNARIAALAAAASGPTGDVPIGAGDLLHIDVFQVQDLSGDVRVSQTGLIALPLIPDRIPVAGCTPYELGEKLDRLLQTNGLVMHPQVSVFVKDQTSEPISVSGAVVRPAILQQSGRTTLIEALAAAGGVANDAGDNILVAREEVPKPTCGEPDPPADPKADPEMIHVKVSDLLEKGDPTFNIPVYGGDVITVPRAGIIYMVGGVVQPGGYALNDPGATFNMMKMIALAHGLASNAKQNSAVVLRKDPTTGQTKQIPVKVKRILQRKDPDIRLYAGDIVYIPTSGLKHALGIAGAAALGVGTGIAIYRIQ